MSLEQKFGDILEISDFETNAKDTNITKITLSKRLCF